MADTTKVATVDAYLETFPPDRRDVLEQVRAAIRRAVPDGEERIRYDMPAVMLGGRYAIHFAGWKQHLALYPVPRFDGELEAAVAPYRTKTDTVSFPWSRPVPYDLIERIAGAIVALRA
jgi:uncharacterized protein YdhG (YjbR/CyaY superfamily)